MNDASRLLIISVSRNFSADREATIRAAVLKARERRAAASNRVAFGGELGGGFTMPLGGFRTYREAWDESDTMQEDIPKKEPVYLRVHDPHKTTGMPSGWNKVHKIEKKDDGSHYVELKKSGYGVNFKPDGNKHQLRRGHREGQPITVHDAHSLTNENVSDTMQEDIPYKGAAYTMRRGGWVVKRNGKVDSIVLPTEDIAKQWIDASRMTMSAKVASVIQRKAKEIARGMGRWSMANESAANRRRVRSWDSAIMPELKPLSVKPKQKQPFDPDPPKKNPGIVAGRNDPNYSRARHLARLGLKKAMEQGK